MTIEEAIAQVDTLRPNAFDTTQKIIWLSVVDMFADREYFHERFTGYDTDQDPSTVLKIPDPYSQAYIHNLVAQIDLYNGEIDRYNNSITLYNTVMEQFGRYQIRNRTRSSDDIGNLKIIT